MCPHDLGAKFRSLPHAVYAWWYTNIFQKCPFLLFSRFVFKFGHSRGAASKTRHTQQLMMANILGGFQFQQFNFKYLRRYAHHKL